MNNEDFMDYKLFFISFYKTPSSVSATRTHVFTVETRNEDHILLKLEDHMKGLTISQNLVKIAKSAY